MESLSGDRSAEGPLLVVGAGAGGELEWGAVGGGGSGDVEAEPGLDAGDGSVGVERPLLVVLTVAVPDDDLGTGARPPSVGVEAPRAVVDGQLAGAGVGP